MEDVVSGTPLHGGSLPEAHFAKDRAAGDLKTIKLWQGHEEAIDAAKQDAQANLPPKLLEKRAYSTENFKLYKAYTEEYLKQSQKT